MGESDEPGELQAMILSQFGAELVEVALRKGEVLFRQGDPADAMYLVVAGRLSVAFVREDGAELAVADVAPGEPVGELGLLIGGKRSATVTAAEDTKLLKLPGAALDQAPGSSSDLLRQLADTVRRRLRRSQLAEALPRFLGPVDSPMFRAIEAEVEWVSLRGGEVLFRQGDAGDCLYILLSGRLRAVAPDGTGATRVLNEVAPGESVGEMALITGDARSSTVHAIRDSSLARLSKEACERISRQYPQVMMGIARVIAHRLRKSEGSLSRVRPAASVAVVPAGPDVPLSAFTGRLVAALSGLGPTLRLSSASFDGHLGIRGAAQIAEDAPRSDRLAAWLDEQEERHRFVVFEADPSATAWTRRCIRQADQIVIVGQAGADPRPGEIEASLLETGERVSAARRTLALLHPDGSRLPSNTAAWLTARHVDDHHHIRLDREADIGRLARCLGGCAIGLALGGGGARGFAHVGVIRALEEAGVPIDLVGGTSMGAVMGAAHAMGMDYERVVGLGKTVFVEGRPHKEYTLPLISVVRSRRLDRVIHETYGDTCIEDLWIPFFCVSCNLTTTEMVVHRRGPVWRAVRASSSLPGVFVPVIEGRNLLVDGGLLNNLPGDLVRQASPGPLIAVEVSPEQELAAEVGEFPSPWRFLWQRLRSPSKPRGVPGILSIMMRTIVVGSDHMARQVKADADLCFRPPVKGYGVLQFEAYREIAEAGYQYARQLLEEMGSKGELVRFVRAPGMRA